MTSRAAALPTSRERHLPCLSGATIVALVILGVLQLGGGTLTEIEVAPLLIGLGAILAVAGMVAARSTHAIEAVEREERARPAREQLQALDGGAAGRSYLEGMQRWAVALLELIDHAAEATDDPAVRDDLLGAAGDTEALRDLLATSSLQDLSLSDAATLHSVCGLWETTQHRIEAEASAVDPAFHRAWQARTIVERLLCHGPPLAASVELPYQA